MRSAFQEELFGTEQYTRLCSICRGEFPRSSEFFPEGRCQDMMASYCRKCANMRAQTQRSSKANKKEISTLYSLEKSCKECGEIKQLREFYMSSQSHDGKTSACKNCTDEKHKEREIRQQQLAELRWAVYFIQDSRNNRVKIGSSDDPELALTSLQEGSSETLHLIANHESGEKDTAEMIVNALHCLFQTHHTRNGWFEMVPSLEQYISLIQHGDFEKAEILLYPIENTENKPSSKPIQKESIEGVVVVDGQSFPSISAASSATGYTAEQLKKYLQNSADSNSPLDPKLQKAG
ncbi:MAG: hypothetical protein QF825_07620 [SAR324 cluster bacterium]|nr:hypothetical protein [SAR324 cluster bacterium]